MIDTHDDAELRGAVRSALGDIVATAPTSAGPPTHRVANGQPPGNRRPFITLAAGLTAAAGILGVLVITNRTTGNDSVANATNPPIETEMNTVAPGPTSPDTSGPAAASSPAVLSGVSPASPSTCGSAVVPDGAASVQAISGDIDGDELADTVTLYSINDEWHISATSSVMSKSSDTVVQIDMHETMAVSFEDIDHSAGAETPPPLTILATGQAANDAGVLASFTFLTLNPDYCVTQWTYDGAPFQWRAFQEPGHVTGMICDGAAGSIHYDLVDSEQNADGSWNVISRYLTHDFTTAVIDIRDPETVADSPEFVETYGNITNCSHDPVTAPSGGGATTTSMTPSPPAGGNPCGQQTTIPAGATDQQTISGDIDGDTVADTVTLYRSNGNWFVYAMSSVKGWSSTTAVNVNVDDSMSIAFFNIDYSLGAETPPPLAVMAIGTGTNGDGITQNFTFLTNTTNYCIKQWTFNSEPFQWVTLSEPGHVTGMVCEGAMGSRYYDLVDAVQQTDGSWHLIVKTLSHNFTTAVLTPLSDQTEPDPLPAEYSQLGEGCIIGG